MLHIGVWNHHQVKENFHSKFNVLNHSWSLFSGFKNYSRTQLHPKNSLIKPKFQIQNVNWYLNEKKNKKSEAIET